MTNRQRVGRYALFCGLGAGLAVHTALLVAARAEGRPLARPFNATGHWLHGQKAGRRNTFDMPHTGVGLATNQAAAMFWGAMFGLYLANARNRGKAIVLRDAAAMGAIASAVDYGLMPKRLTPGWELALSRTSTGLTMAAMALGLAIGGMAARAMEE